jgi:predicted Zn-dependent protease with MMP-like domain
VSRRAFEEVVRKALDSLPPHIAERLENVAVVVEDENAEDPDIFGLFHEDPYMPAKISIYRLPLEEAFPDTSELEEEIRVTVLHELAHYFGMDEGRITDLGYE